MAEEGWYKIDSYTQFMQDAIAAGIEEKFRPSLSAYSRKNKDFKPDECFLDTVGQLDSRKPGVIATAKYIAEYTKKLSDIYCKA